MELRKALAMFRLTGRVPVEELNGTFRDLVKKYHPDKVREHPEWAHERMAEINTAYETLVEWLASPEVADPEKPVDESHRTPAANEPESEDEDHPYHRLPPMPRVLENKFYPIFHTFLDGLGLYFQYGLERVNYREEGVRRFRYREALRTCEKGRDGLSQLASTHQHPALQAAYRFSRLSIADMVLGEPALPPAPEPLRKFDSGMKRARREFDEAIKSILFPELLPAHLRNRRAGGLYSSYTQFVLYTGVFNEGERRKMGILQVARYDSFLDLLELRNQNLLRF